METISPLLWNKMKIVIKKKLYFAFHLPLNGWILKVVAKEANDDIDVKSLVKALKKYVKENGHFDLVNIVASDGTKIKIRI